MLREAIRPSMPLLREAARDAPPKDVFLALIPFARKAEAVIMESPKAVDAKVVAGSPEAGAQEKAGEDEPALLMVRGGLTQGHAAFESWPEGADETRIPLTLRYSQNLLQFFKQTCCCNQISLARGAGKKALDVRSGGCEGLRADIWLRLNQNL